MIIRSYSELSRIDDYEDRFNYLKLNGVVGRPTFGFERYLNQKFYTSREWRNVRLECIGRDFASDMGIQEFPIQDQVIIHHMNPMVSEDIIKHEENILNPEYLISVSLATHNAIHYGDASQLRQRVVDRRPGDTTPWSRKDSNVGYR